MQKSQKHSKSLHPNNKHNSGYNIEMLCKSYPDLEPFVFVNTYGNLSIDFANPKAVKALNTALLKVDYQISYWQFPDKHLCPPIPGRADYLCYVNDLLEASNLKNNISILDIGTGATCIYPLLGKALYNWSFTATEVDKEALKNSEEIVRQNNLQSQITLKLQTDTSQILDGIINNSDKFSAAICNPPFFKSEKEAKEATQRKLKGLGKSQEFTRNFSGTASELWYKGGEKAFLHNYLYQSSLFKTNCFWFTSLVSNKDHVKSMQESLKKLRATKVKILNMHQGNKISRIVAWTFLSKQEQEDWI